MFANVLLVDEINRAMPKTQSALLEAMAEKQVTVEGVTRRLQEPFLVLATENPIEQEGTFPLPEAQLDRFAIKTTLGYPTLDARGADRRGAAARASARVAARRRRRATSCSRSGAAVEHVYVDRLLLRWLVELVRATRQLDEVSVGASVRASLALERARARVGARPRPRLRRPRRRRARCSSPSSRIGSSSSRSLSRRGHVDGRPLLERVRDACLAARAGRPSPPGSRERPPAPLAPGEADVAASSRRRTFPLVPRHRLRADASAR